MREEKNDGMRSRIGWMNEHTTMHVARGAASLSRPIGSTVYDSARVRGGYAGH